MIDLPPAPAPGETVTAPVTAEAAATAPASLESGGPRRWGLTTGSGGPAGQPARPARPPRPARPATADLRDALARAAAGRRFVAGGGAWVQARPGAEAEAAPGGRPDGPLAGTIVAVKDLVAVAGLPLGAGSRTRVGAPPEPRDAAVVAALRAAGAVVAGTVTLHELAFGVSGVNDEVGFPPNPSDPDRVPGGSSSGSAVAVADGTCDLAVGTDTGGSVRIPAALCGVVGFKPGRGRYPRDGILPLAPSLDTVGFLARSMEGVVFADRAVTGEDSAAARARPLRLGIEVAGLAAADPAVASVIETALEALSAAGCELVDVAWPERADVLDVSTTIMFAEAAAVHRELMAGPAAGLLGPAVAARFRAGAAIADADHRAAHEAADGLTVQVRHVLDDVDAVVGPTVPMVAPTIEAARRDDALPRRLVAETRLANVTGLPALSLPAPVSSGALPVGLQLTAASDPLVLAVGAAVAAVLAATEH